MQENLRDRYQPCLLDRLADDAPSDRHEASARRFVSVAELRESVVRDLGWLLNSVHLASVQDLSAYPHVARSVVNFGLPDLAGRTRSSIDLPLLETQLKRAILAFEPRLLPQSLNVEVQRLAADSPVNSLQFTISAQLFAEPVPLAFWLRTEIDLENGEVNLTEWERHG